MPAVSLCCEGNKSFVDASSPYSLQLVDTAMSVAFILVEIYFRHPLTSVFDIVRWSGD